MTTHRRLMAGSFLAMIAVGMGFAARAAVLNVWGIEFGFTKAELGIITGFGLTGFGLTVMLFSVLVERFGYSLVIRLTFALHILSGIVTLLATPVFHAFGSNAVFWCLSIGTTIFAIGNGAAEAAVNPLIAALYPKERTHRLNVLHAGFPGGMILGSLIGVILNGMRWEFILLTYLIPTIGYGVAMFWQPFPASGSTANAISFSEMAREFTSPLLLMLCLLMAMVGFVELGTDSWIASITGTLLDNPQRGLYLFIWSSSLMFVLRFVAGPIVDRISPLGLLTGCACLGAIGLMLLSEAGRGFNFGGVAIAATIAATIYGFGKTFYWATMLGVAAERFPKGGALTIGAMGCIGTLSAGLLGGPVIGFMQDHFASSTLRTEHPPTYQRYRAGHENQLFGFKTTGLDAGRVAVLLDGGKTLARDLLALEMAGKQDRHTEELKLWWESAQQDARLDRVPLVEATLMGSRMALRYTAIVPVIMAIGYLFILLYFRSIGGYKPLHVESPSK